MDSVRGRVDAGECPMELPGVLSALSELENRCREAGLIEEMESERFVDARITLAIKVTDDVRCAVSQPETTAPDDLALERAGDRPDAESLFRFKNAVRRPA